MLLPGTIAMLIVILLIACLAAFLLKTSLKIANDEQKKESNLINDK